MSEKEEINHVNISKIKSHLNNLDFDLFGMKLKLSASDKELKVSDKTEKQQGQKSDKTLDCLVKRLNVNVKM